MPLTVQKDSTRILMYPLQTTENQREANGSKHGYVLKYRIVAAILGRPMLNFGVK